VLQEIGQVRDTPDDLVFDLLQEASYPDQPMGRAILGPEEIVASMPREALLDYMARHYGPARLVFSGAGKVEHDRLVDLASRLFGELPNAAGEPAEPARYRAGTRRVERRPDLEQVHLCLAVEGVPYHDPDHFPLQVLSTALGGGMSSRLFQEARENRGLCYSIFSFAAAHADTGQLGVYAGTDPEDLPELMQVVADETRQLIEEPQEDELARARAQLKAGLLMGLESCSAVSEDLARQLLCFGRRVPVEEVVARIDAVDTGAVRRLGRRLLRGNGLTLAAVGPLEELPRVDLTALAA
jgi:predicted Zn-dependent peptidase